MNKLKNFLEKYENGYLFPYSRLVWITASMVLVFAILIFTLKYFWTSIPNSRKDVHITKEEIRRDKVILEEDLEKYEECTKAAYDQQVDSLKKMTPKSEWNKLFRFEDAIEYVKVQRYQPGYYDYWSGYTTEGYFYDDYEKVNVKRKVDNDTAYPVLLKRTFENQMIDSAHFCEKMRIVNLYLELHKRVPASDASDLMSEQFAYWVSWSSDEFERSDVARIHQWMDRVEGKKIVLGKDNKLSDGKRTVLEVYSKFIRKFQTDSVSENRMAHVDKTLDYLKANGYKKPNANFNILSKVLESNLSDDDMEVALNDYFENKLFKKKAVNPDQDFSKYMNLFKSKVDIREFEQAMEEQERKVQLAQTKEYLIYAFLGILQVIIILVLFSMHRTMREKA